MKITVIVPFKNAARYIERCAASLRNQTGDFEFIFVDDNSTDDPVFETDDRFVLVSNNHKTGVCGARTTGLDIASGDWITFLDADDTMCPDAYRMFTNAIKAGQGFKIYQFNHYRHYAKINKTALKYTNAAGVYPLNRLPSYWCYVWNKLYDADLIKNIRFNEPMKFGEDELFNAECLSKEKRIRCFDTVTMTHIFEDTNSLSKMRTEADILKMARTYEDFIKKHKDPDIRRMCCVRLSIHWSNLYLESLTGSKG